MIFTCFSIFKFHFKIYPLGVLTLHYKPHHYELFVLMLTLMHTYYLGFSDFILLIIVLSVQVVSVVIRCKSNRGRGARMHKCMAGLVNQINFYFLYGIKIFGHKFSQALKQLDEFIWDR